MRSFISWFWRNIILDVASEIWQNILFSIDQAERIFRIFDDTFARNSIY